MKPKMTIKPLSDLAEAMYTYLLTFAVGEQNAIHAIKIAQHFRLRGRVEAQRRIIRLLRSEINASNPDVPVMTSVQGYFVPDVHSSRDAAVAYANKYIAPQERAAISILVECNNKRRKFGLEGQVQLDNLENGSTRVIAVSAPGGN